MKLLKRACGESEEISADWLRFVKASLHSRALRVVSAARSGMEFVLNASVSYNLPFFRRSNLKPESRLQIRLVETWKSRARVRRNKERIEIFRVIFVIQIARDGAARRSDRRSKMKAYDVLAFHYAVGKDEMICGGAEGFRLVPVDLNILHARLRCVLSSRRHTPVQHDSVRSIIQRDANLFRPSPSRRARVQTHAQRVAHIAVIRRAPTRQITRHTRLRVRSLIHHRVCRPTREDYQQC